MVTPPGILIRDSCWPARHLAAWVWYPVVLLAGLWRSALSIESRVGVSPLAHRGTSSSTWLTALSATAVHRPCVYNVWLWFSFSWLRNNNQKSGFAVLLFLKHVRTPKGRRNNSDTRKIKTVKWKQNPKSQESTLIGISLSYSAVMVLF